MQAVEDTLVIALVALENPPVSEFMSQKLG
jgi:hypothetical protein